MRLWSISPEYLDVRGLTALWRETLLAKKVLLGKTKGYKYHTQLERFKKCKNPIAMIDFYLDLIYNESKKREYKYNPAKIGQYRASDLELIEVNKGQIEYEFYFLQEFKLKQRSPKTYIQNKLNLPIKPMVGFKVLDNNLPNSWEKLKG